MRGSRVPREMSELEGNKRIVVQGIRVFDFITES